MGFAYLQKVFCSFKLKHLIEHVWIANPPIFCVVTDRGHVAKCSVSKSNPLEGQKMISVIEACNQNLLCWHWLCLPHTSFKLNAWIQIDCPFMFAWGFAINFKSIYLDMIRYIHTIIPTRDINIVIVNYAQPLCLQECNLNLPMVCMLKNKNELVNIYASWLLIHILKMYSIARTHMK